VITPSLLFVYGTLRRDFDSPMAKRLVRKADWLGTATCRGRLYLVAGYPGMVLSDDPRDRVTGDLFRLFEPAPTLALLDRYEKCGPGFPEPAEYRRELLPVTAADGACVRAWCDLYNQPVDLLETAPSGDYLPFDCRR